MELDRCQIFKAPGVEAEQKEVLAVTASFALEGSHCHACGVCGVLLPSRNAAGQQRLIVIRIR